MTQPKTSAAVLPNAHQKTAVRITSRSCVEHEPHERVGAPRLKRPRADATESIHSRRSSLFGLRAAATFEVSDARANQYAHNAKQQFARAVVTNVEQPGTEGTET